MEYNFQRIWKSIREILGFSQVNLQKNRVEQVTISRTELKNRTIGKAFGSSIFVCIDKNIKIKQIKEMFWRDDLGANENCFSWR